MISAMRVMGGGEKRVRMSESFDNLPPEHRYTVDCVLSGEALLKLALIAKEQNTDPRTIIERAVEAYLSTR